MKDIDKTKAKLIAELTELRQRVAELEISEAERRQAEVAVLKNGEEYRTLVENADESIFVLQDGVVKFANPKALELCGQSGYSIEALASVPFNEFIHPDDRERVREYYLDRMRGKRPANYYCLRALNKNGDLKWIEARSVNIIWRGSPAVLSFVQDATERRQVEEKLRESEEIYRTFFQTSRDCIFITSRDGRWVDVNDATVELFGYKSKGELLKGRAQDIYEDPGERKRITQAIEQRGFIKESAINFRKKDGGIINSLLTAAARKDERGNVIGYQGTFKDITERNRAEEALHKSKAQMQAILDGSPDGIRQVDTNLRILWANRAALARNPYAIGQTCHKAYVNRDKPCEGCPSVKAMETGQIEMGVIYQPASKGVLGECYWEGTGVPMKDDGKVIGVIQIVRNVTKRKQMEEALKIEKERAEQYLDIVGVMLALLDTDGNIALINKRGCEILGYKEKELIGKSWYDTLVPNNQTRDIRRLDFQGMLSGDIKPVKHWERPLLTKDGEERLIAFKVTVVRDQNGKIDGVLLSGEDITEQKRVEAERSELELKAEVASRLASVGEMASGIAHEINNPLTAVIGFAQLLMQRDIPEDVRHDIGVISDNAQRVAGIVKRLLTFARQYKPKREYVDINGIIKAVVALRAYTLETSNIEVTTHLFPDLPRTMADVGQLQQVFLNLVINAETEMKAANGRGNLLIRTEAINSTIRISFKDDGPGIAKENLKRIFDPFFTTREVGQGTGLGLSICHGIIAEHNGLIYARSQLGKGATFIVELPMVNEQKQSDTAEAAADESRRVAGARILVVDDEPFVLQLLGRLLTVEGHKVDTSSNPNDALERIKSTSYNLILLDIKLQEMSGIELYERIQEIGQSLADRVVFITGDVMGADTRAFLDKTKAPYFAKPFDPRQLSKDVSRILSQGALSLS